MHKIIEEGQQNKRGVVGCGKTGAQNRASKRAKEREKKRWFIPLIL